MKIITCFKLVPEEQDIVVTAKRTLNFDRADAKISKFDLNTIEAATQLAGAERWRQPAGQHQSTQRCAVARPQ